MKKVLPYILILAIMIGTFVPVVSAQTPPTTTPPIVPPTSDSGGTCYFSMVSPEGNPITIPTDASKEDCKAPSVWSPDGTPPAGTTTPGRESDESALSKALDTCNAFSFTFLGCFERFIYFVFVVIPSGILVVVAKMFNFMAALTLSSDVYKYPFIDSIWRVIRDFANIFFILVLLYAAFQTILGLGHGAKKIVVDVIIMALVINFSLFATRVVIDSGNILGLIFYNKITTTTNYQPVSNETDIAGALSSSFNVNTFFSPDLFNNLTLDRDVGISGLGKLGIVVGATVAILATGGLAIAGGVLAGGSLLIGAGAKLDQSSAGVLLSMMVMYGLIIYSMIYAFFVVALAFLGRMMSLMMLMVVSPFAFMSFAVPAFKKIDRIGFDSWLHKLIDNSFVAAIFMFILYVISEILRAGVFTKAATHLTGTGVSFTTIIVMIFMPGILITMLLLAGAKYAQKASGDFTDKIVGMGKAVVGTAAGLAIGGGIGLAAKAGKASLGHLGKRAFESKTLADMETDKNSWRNRFIGRNLRTLGGKAATSSFDARAGIIGTGLKLAGGATGINLGHDSKILREEGGYEGDLKRRRDKDLKRAEGLKKAVSGEATEHLHQTEENNLLVERKNEKDLLELDGKIASAEGKRIMYKDVKGQEANYDKYANEVIELKNQKSALKSASIFFKSNGTIVDYTDRTHDGKISEAAVSNAKIAADNAEAAKAAADAAKAAAPAAHSAAVKEQLAADAAVLAAADAARLNPSAANTAAAEAANNAAIAAAKKVDSAFASIRTTADAAIAAGEKATRIAAEANRLNTAALGGRGYSQNDYKDDLIPEAKRVVKKAENEIAWAFAGNVEKRWFPFFRNAARKKSAHEIRMGAKPEKSHGSGRSHFGEDKGKDADKAKSGH